MIAASAHDIAVATAGAALASSLCCFHRAWCRLPRPVPPSPPKEHGVPPTPLLLNKQVPAGSVAVRLQAELNHSSFERLKEDNKRLREDNRQLGQKHQACAAIPPPLEVPPPPPSPAPAAAGGGVGGISEGVAKLIAELERRRAVAPSRKKRRVGFGAPCPCAKSHSGRCPRRADAGGRCAHRSR
jgi:hypothetical protein